MITVKKFIVNPLQENSYLLFDETSECIIIDAGFYYGMEHDEITSFIKNNGLKPVKLINTHCHFDHIMGVEFIRGKYKLSFECHESDAFWVEKAQAQSAQFGIEMLPVSYPDHFISETDVVEFGNSHLEVIHVPGHSPGHLVFYSPANSFIVAGDVLFYGGIGRADLPGGNYNQLVNNIHQKLMVLPGETKVFCGHGPDTTIAFEKENNPFLN